MSVYPHHLENTMRLSNLIASLENVIAESHIDVHAKAAYHGVVEGAKAGYVAAKHVGLTTYASEAAAALPDWKLKNAAAVARERGNLDVAIIFEAEMRRREPVAATKNEQVVASMKAARKPAGKPRVTGAVATSH